MKRTRLRHRSKTNSRPWEDVEVRRQYLADNPQCELKKWLYTHIGPEIDKRDESADPHHIVGGNGKRHDRVSNIITVCRSVHDWIHAHPIDGKVICLWWKMNKGELRPDEFREISGMYLAGWLEIRKPTLAVADGPYRELCEMLMGQD